ncbi:MAG: hypothetical protein IPF98_02640 [Gemmatimonadetes bacterium]|jgi:hypothetical protein|nr:hypothetical protein [Gemmatimonadota bacterium]MCC6771345.1 hypothetical protein [Gemmatimonadaceae bacterium]
MRGADELRAAATRVSAGPVTLLLEVEAWRSFQPIVGDVGDPLIAILRLQAVDSVGVPGAVAVDGVYLVRGTEVVQVAAREEQPRGDNARTVEFVVRDGPRWAAGDSIDVVAAVSGSGGPPVLLRAPRVSILRVD